MNKQIEQAYWNGFRTKCAEMGVDAEALVKEGARYGRIIPKLVSKLRLALGRGKGVGADYLKALSMRGGPATPAPTVTPYEYPKFDAARWADYSAGRAKRLADATRGVSFGVPSSPSAYYAGRAKGLAEVLSKNT